IGSLSLVLGQTRVLSPTLGIIPQIYKTQLPSFQQTFTTSEDACHRCGRNVRRECFWNMAIQPGKLTTTQTEVCLSVSFISSLAKE
uniref:Uncharacterized protein n=1 Tax=Anolis carolinensis TaxID=28377 RepID=A0A803TWG5_ANOCA